MRLITSYILLTFGVIINVSSCSWYDNNLAEAMTEIAKSGDTTSLSAITSREWDKVYVIGPYQSFDCSIVKRIPKKVKAKIRTLELYDSWFGLVFTLNQKFISYSEVISPTIDELGIKGASVYMPTTVIPIKDEGPMTIDHINDCESMFDGGMSSKTK